MGYNDHDNAKEISNNIASNISKILSEGDSSLTTKEIAERSGINYSTLAPILRGERDFRVSNLLSLADALNVTPNKLLDGLFSANVESEKANIAEPKYFAAFVTDVGLTHCRLINLETEEEVNNIYTFSLFCTTTPANFFEQIKSPIEKIFGKINLKQVYVYTSAVGYEHIICRQEIERLLRKELGAFVLEPDWMPVYNTLLAEKNGILITINNGCAISYSNDHGKTINKVQGYNFPISDEAGNFWLGCEAIKHAINVKEGVDARSLLSDKVLSLVNSDLNLLAAKAHDDQRGFFVEVASIVKELAGKKGKAQDLIEKSFDSIWKRVKQIDQDLGVELPVYFSGDLAYLYEDFIPKNRYISVDFENAIDKELSYAIKKLASQETKQGKK